uniref:Uncharacterized protein n=1 Tax=Cacopsylla melanoneura TaxID=428564 RepID=A0A8D9EUC2_9HEMI
MSTRKGVIGQVWGYKKPAYTYTLLQSIPEIAAILLFFRPKRPAPTVCYDHNSESLIDIRKIKFSLITQQKISKQMVLFVFKNKEPFTFYKSCKVVKSINR